MATLNVNNGILAVLSDEHNIALSLNSKQITRLQSNPPTLKEPPMQHPHFGLIRRCSAFSHDGLWYAVAVGRNLTTWSTVSWRQECVKTLRRSASRIVFTPSNDKILVADKTGDVHSYSIHEDSSDSILLLGHLSILLDMLITPDEKFIITCDRDEKIRVSHYPNTYNIARFCLGHTSFVTKLLLLDNGVLLSSSGDGTLKFWNFLKGECISTHYVKQNVADDVSQIITNVSTINISDKCILCVSVFNFNGILVYSCVEDENYRLILKQKIDCCEPLDFVTCESILWILKFSTSCLLNALFWDECSQKYIETVSPSVKDILRIVNEECTSIIDSYVDLTVLHKKFDLKKETTAKKIKLK